MIIGSISIFRSMYQSTIFGTAADRKARAAVGHDTLALGRSDRRAQIGLARQTRRALPAFRHVGRDHVIAAFHRRHIAPDLDHETGAFMAQDRGKQAFRIGTRAGEFVGVADAPSP